MTDGGSVFRANQAKAVYEAAGIAKHEIERGKPWQSYIETTFNIQRRMADWHFAKARTDWPRSPGRGFSGRPTQRHIPGSSGSTRPAG